MSNALSHRGSGFVLMTILFVCGGVLLGGYAPRLLNSALSNLRFEPSGQVESPLLCCVTQDRSLRLVNIGWLRSAGITDVGTTCGCVEVVSFPREIRSGETGDLRVRISPGPHEDQIGVSLTLVGADGAALPYVYREKVAPPFQGWPKNALCRVVDGKVELRIDQRYEEWLEQAIFFGKSGEQQEAEFDSGTHVVSARLPAWERGIEEVVIVFKSGQRWAGPLVFREPGLNDAP